MDRYSDICKLLDSIEDQTYPETEVIFVVDQVKSLFTAVQEYVNKKNFHNFSFTVLLNKGESGVNICRNIATLATHGNIVGIVDDDTILFPNWVENTLKAYRESDDIAAVTGPAIPLWDDPVLMSWFPQELYFVWGCPVWNWETKRDIRNVGGENCSFRKDILLKAGLYLPRIGPQGGEERIRWFYPSGEEIELCLRIRRAFPNLKILWDPGISVYHKAERIRFNIRFIIKRMFRGGYTRNYVRHLYTFDDSDNVLSLEEDYLKAMLFSIPRQFFKGLFEKPDLAFKRLMMVTIGYLFAGLGYIAYEIVPYPRKRGYTSHQC
jgi:glycosyltransferase involved in cell wall biosynthesis